MACDSELAGMSAGIGVFAVSCIREPSTGATALQREQQLNRFLAEVERRALRIAQIALRDRDEALDLVQEAMIKLVRNYSDRAESEWAPLFYRILQNRLRDWHRRRAVRRRLLSWLPGRPAENAARDTADPVDGLPDTRTPGPAQQTAANETFAALSAVLTALPPRQQQTFLLRAWEGLSVAETARAMACSEGTVKTQYSRAVQTLRDRLGDHWP